ncbi:threonine ammonia-lyase [Prosthecomicrobium sp. N25]|uniref:threonine ammonia-lyase n=1 Tax=Prosthecomicrobium sp. N25 TaxID=3129254 RepID=UPI0030778B7E
MTAVPTLPTPEDVRDAAERIRGEAVRTPLLTSPALDRLTGGRVFLKPECLQRTGSFKFRGAYNAVSRIPEAARAAGVVACSSGNHAQGVAAAAELLGLPATIVMPSDAPALKKERTQGYGATVVEYDRATEDRDALTERLAAEKGATLVHPFENFHVIAGQGTVGLEIVEDMARLGLKPDVVLVCCGGGGLTAGVALAVKAAAPDAQIYPVEPAGFDDQARSFAAGERVGNARTSGSICDALLTPMPGVMSFAINRERVTRGLVVTDAEALQAVAFAARELKLVVEPGGAVALAAALTGKVDLTGKTVAIVLSGGNIDGTTLARAVG